MAKGQHKNSVAAFKQMIASGARETVSLKIYKLMLGGVLFTERWIADALGYKDIYTVRRRVSEMLADGILIEDGDHKDEVTGKTVRLVRIRTESDPPLKDDGPDLIYVNEFLDDAIVSPRSMPNTFVGQRIDEFDKPTLIKLIGFLHQEKTEAELRVKSLSGHVIHIGS